MKLTLELLNTILLIAPGFISVKIFDIIGKRKNNTAWEKLIEAIIFFFLIYIFTSFCYEWKTFISLSESKPPIFIVEKDFIFLGLLTFFSVLFPVIFTYLVYSDWYMKLLRKIKITDQTGRASTWIDVFSEQKRFLIVHLKDNRSIYGWPLYFSNNSDEGHIYLQFPEWRGEDEKVFTASEQTHGILIQKEEIELIEFVKEEDENNQESN